MRKNFLNFIIILSILGILIITARDYFMSKKLTNKNLNQITSTNNIPILITQTPQNNDPEIPCQNRYFNFKKGTTWRYKLKSEINVQGQKQLIDNFLTNKIIESSPSSVIIQTTFDNQNNPEKKTNTISVLTCRKSGIYGFPFSFLKLDKSILFLPEEEKLKKDNQWQTKVGLNFSSPLPISPLKINIDNKIVNEEKQTVLNLGTVNTLMIKSSLGLNQPILKDLNLLSQKIFEYQLGENIGLLSFNFNLNSKELGNIKVDLELIDYTFASNIF